MRFLGYVEHKDDTDWIKHCKMMEVDEIRQMGRLRKTLRCVKEDMKRFGFTDKMHRTGGMNEEGRLRG